MNHAFIYLVLSLNIHPSTASGGAFLALCYVCINGRFLLKARRWQLSLLFSLLLPLLLLLGLGAIIGLKNGNGNYELLKDAYFVLKAIVLLTFGYILYRKHSLKTLLSIFVRFGVLVSVIFLLLLMVGVGFDYIDFSTVSSYRKSIPDLPYDPLVSVVILVFLPSLIRLPRVKNISFIYSQVAAILSTLSRFSFLILILIGFFTVKRKMRLSPAVFILFGCSLFGSLILLNDVFPISVSTQNLSGIKGELIHKIGNIGNEVFLAEFSEKSEVVQNWRAYEAMQGLLKYMRGTANDKLLGFGFGELTDINITIRLGGVVRNNIPIFHNGYIYLLVKVGLLGLILWFSFLFVLVRCNYRAQRVARKRPRDSVVNGLNAAMWMVTGMLVFVTAVFFGIFSNAIFNNLLIVLSVVIFFRSDRVYQLIELPFSDFLEK